MKFRNYFIQFLILILSFISTSCLYIETHREAIFNNIPDEICSQISVLKIQPLTEWESNNFDKDETNDNLFFEMAKEESFKELVLLIGNCNDVMLPDLAIKDIEINFVTRDEKSIPATSYMLENLSLYYDKNNSIRYKKCEEEEKTAIKIDVRLGEYIKIQDLKEISVKMNLFNNGEFMEVNRVYNIKKVKNKRTVLPQIIMEIQRR